MNSLINDLLNLSKISREEMNIKHVNLSAMAMDIIDELHQREPARKIKTVVHESLFAHGDPRLLNIMLTNLLNNTWEYTSKTPDPEIEFGKVSTAVGTTNAVPTVPESHKVTFFIRDNGAGFSSELAGKLFKPFQRLHSDSEFPGTGIGLATVDRVIKRHGGKVWADGSVGKGATFYFTLNQ